MLPPEEETALTIPLKVKQDPADIRRLAAQLARDMLFHRLKAGIRCCQGSAAEASIAYTGQSA
jgi:hypothetical protein